MHAALRHTLKLIFYVLIFFGSAAHSSEPPESVRKGYALKFHEAFILQSIGQSTGAFNRFLEAFQQGTDAGESPKKLQAAANLFYWYRQHGACLKLFGQQPSFRERISGEYCNCGKNHGYGETVRRFSLKPPIVPQAQHSLLLAKIPDYRSEYGTSPEQAAIIREFMFGTGEVIAGIFCITVGSSFGVTGLGWYLAQDGGRTIWNTMNHLWTIHETALVNLKKLTDEAESVAKQ